MKRNIYQAIKNYQYDNTISFHVPGHKNGRAYTSKLTPNIYDNTAENGMDLCPNFDLTEIPDMDNLHYPRGIIDKAQRQAAHYYGAKNTYFLVNGTTCGIHAMILSSTNRGDKIIIPRNCHKSVYNACILGDLEPIMAYPTIDDKLGLTLNIDVQHIKCLLENHENIKAVLITSPTYEGIHSNILEIAKIVHKYGALLLVDEAHGAHIPLHTDCGIPALQQGADIVVQSTHKSLSSLTQSSILHIGSNRINEHKVKQWLSILQSSSPSYLLMSSLEKSIYDMITIGQQKMQSLLITLENFRHQFPDTLILAPNKYNSDPTKICILCDNAVDISNILRSKYQIQVEYASTNYIICIASIWNTTEDILKLEYALTELLSMGKIQELNYSENMQLCTQLPLIASERKLTPKDAFYSVAKTLPISMALNTICLETITPYPPGIPLIMAGEIFTKKHYDYICLAKKIGIELIGQKNISLNTLECL